ncbi:hypothetical protein [Mycolicibacterium sp. S3B2]|uniref:hypothetical protein n=1 Tax=Mycolicibacterium sp. S3B2 TaxID=3415120 RepID=UPI003C7B0E0F
MDQWVEAGIPAPIAASFLEAGASLEEAHAWMASEITTDDAVTFVRGKVAVDSASLWLSKSEFSADDVVDFIRKEVSLEQALGYAERGIGSHQVVRTADGLELDIDPWQEDPLDQLPQVIEPGSFSVTLWTSALGGDPVAHEVDFSWNGGFVAGWYEDISMRNDLSYGSSSPAHGLLAWPGGKDVAMTFNWGELGLEGHDRLPGMAPRGPVEATDPKFWIGLAGALIDFVLLDLGSRSSDDTVQYSDDEDWELDIEDMFRQFLDSGAATAGIEFQEWIDQKVAAGTYTVRTDE